MSATDTSFGSEGLPGRRETSRLSAEAELDVDFSRLDPATQYRHPTLRLLSYERPQHPESMRRLATAADPGIGPERRTLALLDYIHLERGTQSVAEVNAIALELIEVLEPMTRDPRLVEEAVRIHDEQHAALLTQPGLTKKPKLRALSAAWVRTLASSPTVITALATGEVAWTAGQCIAAINLLRRGLTEPDGFQPADARIALQEWALPFWDVLLVAHSQSLAFLSRDDFHANYSQHAQRRLWNRLEPPAFTRSTGDDSSAEAGRGQHLVITAPIPTSADKADREMLAFYEALRIPIPLVTLPAVEQIQQAYDTLLTEFPWAKDAIDAMVGDALTRRLFGAVELLAPQLLLLGPKGSGKSRLARRFAEVFNLPTLSIELAGSSDHKIIAGTARGWAGGQPSPIVSTILQAKVANPVIILDEMDKAVSHSQAGPAPVAVLHGLLEPDDARQWRDIFLQAPCDLSKVIWIATGNSASNISGSVLSRMRQINVPSPTADHLKTVLPQIRRDIARSWGVSTDVLPDLPESLVTKATSNLRDLKFVANAHLRDYARANLLGKPKH